MIQRLFHKPDEVLERLPWLIRGQRCGAPAGVDPWFAEVFEGNSGHCFHQGLQDLGLGEQAIGDEKRWLGRICRTHDVSGKGGNPPWFQTLADGVVLRGAVSGVFGAKGGHVQLLEFRGRASLIPNGP